MFTAIAGLLKAEHGIVKLDNSRETPSLCLLRSMFLKESSCDSTQHRVH
jgi:hypothetical protein